MANTDKNIFTFQAYKFKEDDEDDVVSSGESDNATCSDDNSE